MHIRHFRSRSQIRSITSRLSLPRGRLSENGRDVFPGPTLAAYVDPTGWRTLHVEGNWQIGDGIMCSRSRSGKCQLVQPGSENSNAHGRIGRFYLLYHSFQHPPSRMAPAACNEVFIHFTPPATMALLCALPLPLGASPAHFGCKDLLKIPHPVEYLPVLEPQQGCLTTTRTKTTRKGPTNIMKSTPMSRKSLWAQTASFIVD
jgi:hypothetical protein